GHAPLGIEADRVKALRRARIEAELAHHRREGILTDERRRVGQARAEEGRDRGEELRLLDGHEGRRARREEGARSRALDLLGAAAAASGGENQDEAADDAGWDGSHARSLAERRAGAQVRTTLVISAGAPSRIGGPQKPVPWLT